MNGYLVLESGEIFSGQWLSASLSGRAGEVVFNTSHSGYEEVATDPSYHNQIMVMTSPMQGNYGVHQSDWESNKVHIQGFICLEMQKSKSNQAWLQTLTDQSVPVLENVDTRQLTLLLREKGTPWGALVHAANESEAQVLAQKLISEKKQEDKDWVFAVSRKSTEIRKGTNQKGPRVAVLDFGVKENTLRQLSARCSEVAVFNSRATFEEISKFHPNGIMLSNGPGNPEDVQVAVDTIKAFLGKKPIFGICMGHQLLSLALGAKTYKLRFGHRGGNHPVKDTLLNKVYMTSQNHGYAVDDKSLPQNIKVTHTNLYDGTVEGIEDTQRNCWSVQFHPEACPGPLEAEALFDRFMEQMR